MHVSRQAADFVVFLPTVFLSVNSAPVKPGLSVYQLADMEQQLSKAAWAPGGECIVSFIASSIDLRDCRRVK